VLNNEIIKRLEAFNNSRRFYRVLFLVEECRDSDIESDRVVDEETGCEFD
jgi:hypothetical protein